MTKTSQDFALSHLLYKRDDLTKRLARIETDRHRIESALSADSGERAVECENDEVLDRLAETTALELAQVRRAIDHINIGHYGICAKCEKPISSERLRAVPEATECASCAQV